MTLYNKPVFFATFLLLSFFFRNLGAQCSGTPNGGTISTPLSTICTVSTAAVAFTTSGLSTGTGISYQWQVSSGGSFTNVPVGNGSTTLFYTTPYLPMGTYSYQVRTTCAPSALSNTSTIFVIHIRPTPSITTSGTLTPGNNATIVTTGGTSPYTYSWSPSVSTGSVGTALGFGVYTVMVTDNSNCADTVVFGVSAPVQLWGITHSGGTSSVGTLYTCNPPVNTFSKTLDFIGSNGGYGGHLMQAGNGKLYAISHWGGTFSLGVVYSYNHSTNTYSKIVDFNGSSNGASPYAGLIQANNGKLYGMTSSGGANNSGVLYEINPATNTFTKAVDFTTVAATPTGELLQGSNGKLYGYAGGQSGEGVLFEYDISLNTYTVKVNFSLASGKGYSPSGSLIQASNGKLYGTTAGGGQFNYGVLFEYDLSLNTYSVRATFNGTNGSGPIGPLVEASNGKLYGVAQSGGTNGNGVIFEYDPATTNFVKKIDFNAVPTGKGPVKLIKGSNGNLYGITVLGGTGSQTLMNNQGTLFEYNITSNALFKKIDFDGPIKGGMPTSLIELMPPCTVTILSSANNSAVCAGSNVTLTASGTTNYSWSTGATTPSIVVSPSVTTNFSFTGSSPSCVTPTLPALAMVTVDPLPNLVANNIIICSGNTGTLIASGADTYSWSTGATTSSITASPASTTNYTVTGYSLQGCVRSETVSITVFTTPTVAVNSATICAGQTATLTAWGLETYTWNTTATTSVVNVSPASTSIYTVSGSICSVAVTNTAQVWVNPLPTITITNATVCSNQVATLTPGGASSYSVNGVANNTFTFQPATTSTFAVSGSSNNCVSLNTAIATVSVNAAPIISVTSITICSGQTATLIPGGAVSYSVNGSANNTFTFNPINTTTYTFTGSDNTCASNPLATTISVNAIPIVSITAATICSGQTATLVPGGANSYSVNGVARTTFTFNPINTTTYAVTGSSINCVSMPVVATVSVNARPVISVNNVTVCAGQIVTLTPSGASSYSVNTVAHNTFTFNAYNTSYFITGSSNNCVSSNTAIATVTVIPAPWIYVADDTICAGQTATLIPYSASSYSVNGVANNTFTFSPANTSTYAVTGASNNCVSLNTVVVTVSVNPLPTVSINNAVICSGQSATLQPTGAATYTVSGGSFTVSPTSTASYSVTGTDVNGCVSANPAIATVSVNASPTISASSGSMCLNTVLNMTVTGANSYSVNGNAQNTFTFSPATTTSYVVTGEKNNCLSGPVVATVTVYSLPVLSVNDATICANQTAVLTASGAVTYTWSSGPAGASVTVTPLTNTTYSVTGTDNRGCENSTSVLVVVEVCTGMLSMINEEAGLRIFPNPNSGVFIIECPPDLEISILNVMGQVVHEQRSTAQKTAISLAHIANGVYYVKVGGTTTKVVKD